MGLTAYNVHFDQPQSGVVLRALRAVSALSTTILFLPLSSVLMRGLSCPTDHDTWMNTGLECSSGGRVAISIFLALLLVGFALLSVTVSAVYIDRDPASESWAAKTHGRIDALVLVAKLVLAFVYNVLDERLVGTAGVSIVLILLGIGITWLFATY